MSGGSLIQCQEAWEFRSHIWLYLVSSFSSTKWPITNTWEDNMPMYAWHRHREGSLNLIVRRPPHRSSASCNICETILMSNSYVGSRVKGLHLWDQYASHIPHWLLERQVYLPSALCFLKQLKEEVFINFHLNQNISAWNDDEIGMYPCKRLTLHIWDPEHISLVIALPGNMFGG